RPGGLRRGGGGGRGGQSAEERSSRERGGGHGALRSVSRGRADRSARRRGRQSSMGIQRIFKRLRSPASAYPNDERRIDHSYPSSRLIHEKSGRNHARETPCSSEAPIKGHRTSHPLACAVASSCVRKRGKRT